MLLLLGGLAVGADDASPVVPPSPSVRLITVHSDGVDAGAWSNGGRYLFSTTEAIPESGDTDAASDIFELHADGSTTLLSDSAGSRDAVVNALSADGRTLVYSSDWAPDHPFGGSKAMYVKVGSKPSQALATDSTNAQLDFQFISTDGSVVVFATFASLVAEDRNRGSDPYEWRASDGSIRLVGAGTPEAAATSGPSLSRFAVATPDGRHVFFIGNPPEPSSDGLSVFERLDDGTARLVIGGLPNLTTSLMVGVSDDGDRAFIETKAAIAGTGDRDALIDVYQVDRDGSVHLISVDTADADAVFSGSSATGDRVRFHTLSAVPGSGDHDHVNDVYERRNLASTRLLTPGTAEIPAYFIQASRDGSRVFFHTEEALPGTGDSDYASDAFVLTDDGHVTLETPGAEGRDAHLYAVSPDGLHALFETEAPLRSVGDSDASLDAFRIDADGTVRIATPGTTRPATTNGNWLDWYDPRRLLFRTSEPLVDYGDTDTTSDTFALVWPDDPSVSAQPADTTVRVELPRCARGSTRSACQRYRRRASAWHLLAGAIAGPAPTRILVGLTRQRGGACARLEGQVFKAIGCDVRRRARLRATISGARWTYRVGARLRPGSYVISLVVEAANGPGRQSSETRFRIGDP